MTVLVGAMNADSRGSVVGRGRGDCSCFTVVSYRMRQEHLNLFLLNRDCFAIIQRKHITYLCVGTCWLSCRRNRSSMRTEVTPPPLAP